MARPPMPGDHVGASAAEDDSYSQPEMIGTVLRAVAGVVLAATLYLVTSAVDSDLNTGDRIVASVLVFALAFLLTAAVGFHNQLNAARSRFLESLIDLSAHNWTGSSSNGLQSTGEDPSLQFFVSRASSMGNIRGLSRIDFERLTAMVRRVSILNAGFSPPDIPSNLNDERTPDSLTQAGMEALGLLERREYDEAFTKLSALRDRAINQLGSLHQFTLRIRACIAYLHEQTGDLGAAKNELQDLLLDQLKKYCPDNDDITWTVQLLTEITNLNIAPEISTNPPKKPHFWRRRIKSS